MLLSRMPQHTSAFGPFRRKDGEDFTINAVLYETPPDYDYWRAHLDAVHAKWGHMGFTLIIPKKIAPDVTHASVIVGGSVLDQVKSALTKVTADGRDLTWCPSKDGWFLVG